MEEKEQKNTTKNNISDKVVRGGAWMFGRMLFTNVINLVVMAILARQLSPAAFGLAALANVILRFFNILTSQGSNQYVIYDNKEGREERVNAAFWLDLTMAVGCTAVGLLMLPLITAFYKEPGLAPIMIVLFLKYPIDSISKVPDALLKKNLEFKKIELRDTILEIFSGVLSVILSIMGYGVWSLIIPGIIASPIRAIIVFSMSKWVPLFRLNLELWPKILKFSANVIGGTFTSFILTEGDSLIIGKLMGSHALGVYNLAWQSANIVGRTVVTLSNKLTLPALSKVAHDNEKLKSTIARILKLLSITTFPLLIGLFVVADDFIITVYGNKWSESILPLRILIIFALRYAAGSPMGTIFVVLGRPDINFKAGLMAIPFYIAAIFIGSRYGVVGVAVAVTIVRSLNGVAYFLVAAKLLKENFWSLVTPMRHSFIASLIMSLVVLIFKLIFTHFDLTQNFVSLILLTAIGGITYLILLRTTFNHLSMELSQVTLPLLGHQNKIINKILKVK